MGNRTTAPAMARIPRGTCKLFGAIKALSTIRKSAVLVHGPKGCVYNINYILGMRGDRPSEIYSTALSEQDVIFGAGEKLEEAIRSLDASLCPDLLFVLSCCTSEIIGEDVECAARTARTRAKTIAIPAGGFSGDFHEGYSETLCTLVRELAHEPAAKDPRSVNLAGMLRAGPDLAEMRALLARIGVSVNAVLTADASRAELEHVGCAALTVVLCEPAGKGPARLLESLYGTPFIIEEIPMGYRSAGRFLKRAAEALAIPVDDRLPDESARPDCSFLRSRRIAIISGPTRAVSFVRFLAEYEVMPELVIADFDCSLEEKFRCQALQAGEVLIEPDHGRILEKLKEHRIDLLVGGMLEQPVAKALGIRHIDIMHGSQATVGFSGAENLARLLRTACSIDTPVQEENPGDLNRVRTG